MNIIIALRVHKYEILVNYCLTALPRTMSLRRTRIHV